MRTIRSHQAYYERWAKTWEFQALLKAWVSAGDREVGLRYKEAISPLVWEAASRENFVEDVQAMRRRVEEHVPANEAARQLKLGPGGLRDVEFSVQRLLQLVHGRTDPSLRSATHSALSALAKGGYVARDDAATLDRPTGTCAASSTGSTAPPAALHLMPDNPADLRRLGRAMGHRTHPARPSSPTARPSRGRFAGSTSGSSTGRSWLPSPGSAPTRSASRRRPRAAAARPRLRDPAGALRHIEALTTGVSRRAAIPAAAAARHARLVRRRGRPDAGLLSFRRVSDALGTTHWYLKMLRDEGRAADRLARSLARSRYAADLLFALPTACRCSASPAASKTASRKP